MITPIEKHEQGFRSLIHERSLMEPGSVNDRMSPEFVSCSPDGRTVTVRYKLKPEMRNPMGWLHGGVTSTMIDMGMGLLAFYCSQSVCPTSSMTVNYLKPNRIGGYLVVRSSVKHLGRHMVYMSAECWMEDDPDKLTATATGTYAVITHTGDNRTMREKINSLRKP